MSVSHNPAELNFLLLLHDCAVTYLEDVGELLEDSNDTVDDQKLKGKDNNNV